MTKWEGALECNTKLTLIKNNAVRVSVDKDTSVFKPIAILAEILDHSSIAIIVMEIKNAKQQVYKMNKNYSCSLLN